MNTTAKMVGESRLLLAERLVASVLRKHGEITFTELQAIPLIENRAEIESVLQRVGSRIPIKVVQRKIQNKPLLRWEKVVQVTTKSAGAGVEPAPD